MAESAALNDPDPRRRGFTLVELLVVIGIIALLVSILLPTLGKAREYAKTVQCLSNFRQIGQAANLYAAQYKGYTVPGYAQVGQVVAGNGQAPDAENYATVLVNGRFINAPNVTSLADAGGKTNSAFFCPSGLDDFVGFQWSTTSGTASPTPNGRQDMLGSRPWRTISKSTGIIVDTWYGINATLDNFDTAKPPCRRLPGVGNSRNPWELPKLGGIRKPSDMVMLFDGLFINLYFDSDRISARHGKRTQTNLLFFDGHAATVQTKTLPGGYGPTPNGAGNPFNTLAGLAGWQWPKWRLDQN